MAASYDFVQLDVFTRTQLAGNPLAIFTDARGLADKQMQALAREMSPWRIHCGITPRNRNPITIDEL